MESSLFVGVGQLDLLMRHSRSLKDKRQVLQSLKVQFRNHGFSVVELGPLDDFKQGSLGLSYAASSHQQVEEAFDKAARLLVGEFQVVRKQKEILDFSNGFEGDLFQLDTEEGEFK